MGYLKLRPARLEQSACAGGGDGGEDVWLRWASGSNRLSVPRTRLRAGGTADLRCVVALQEKERHELAMVVRGAGDHEDAIDSVLGLIDLVVIACSGTLRPVAAASAARRSERSRSCSRVASRVASSDASSVGSSVCSRVELHRLNLHFGCPHCAGRRR